MLLVERELMLSLFSHSVLAVDVDGEVAAVRSLDDEGLRVGVDADDGGVELVDVGSGVAGPTALTLKVGVTWPVIWPLEST